MHGSVNTYFAVYMLWWRWLRTEEDFSSRPSSFHRSATHLESEKYGAYAANARHVALNSFHVTRYNQITVPAHLTVPALMEKMAVDKKNKGGKKAVVVLSSVGGVWSKEPVLVEDQLIERVISEYIVVVPPKDGLLIFFFT